MVVQNYNRLCGMKAEFSKVTKTLQFWGSDLDTYQGQVWELLLMQSSKSGLFPFFHFVADGPVFVQLCPGVPLQSPTAPGEELLSEYFKVGQAGSCFVRFISKDFQCLQWEAIFILSRGYLLL